MARDNKQVQTKVIGYRERRYPSEPRSSREILEYTGPSLRELDALSKKDQS